MTDTPDFVAEAIRKDCDFNVVEADEPCPWPACGCSMTGELALICAGLEAAAKIADSRARSVIDSGWNDACKAVAKDIRTEAARLKP